ncbi:hypothetical protein ACS0TY_023648 [Phlomoides rotata]
MGKKKKQCCKKDMGPNRKKLKTGVFNRTRSNTNSPSSRPTPLASASCTSSRLGDIPPMDTSENPSTTPTAGVEQDPPTTNPPTTTADGVEQDAGEGPSNRANTEGQKKRKAGVRRKERPNTNAESDFFSPCSPRKLLNLLEILNEKQKTDVRSIGFGGLFSLNLTKCSDHRILSWLIKNFNSKSRVLYIDGHRFFAITADDIYDVLMLPRNECSPVLKYTRKEDGADMVRYLKDKYRIKTTKSLFETIRDALVDGGADFKRLFIMYCLSSFLTPSPNQQVTTGVVKSLIDVEKISKLDWSSYILDFLCDSISQFKKPGSKNVGGCIILLQILYFHRLKWHGVSEPCTLPLIQHWTDRKIRDRCSEFKDILMSMGREAAEFSNKYTSKLTHLIEKTRASKENVGGTSSTPTPEMSDSQSFFMDERLHKYVDDLQQNFVVTQKLTNAILSCELLSPDPPVRDEAYYGVDVSEGEEIEEDRVVGNEEELSSAMKSVTPKSKRLRTDLPSRFWNITADIGYVSKYMTKYKKSISKMSQPHKEILDYCFYHSEKDSSLERYYRRGYYLLIEKIDILSMLPNRHINVQIINAWCNVINHDSLCDGVRSRFIFSLDHSDALIEHMAVENSEKLFSNCKSSWDYWLDTTMDRLCSVDMIFIPFQVENHYAAAVVDFIDAKVHYLDNRKYSDSVVRVTFCDAAEALRKSLSSYLISKNHPKAKDILTFELENIPFPWQTSRADSDCGVYLMHHMKNFDGVVYTSPDMNKVH